MANTTNQFPSDGAAFGDFRNISINTNVDVTEPPTFFTAIDLVWCGIVTFIILANAFTRVALTKCRLMATQMKALSLCLNSADLCIGTLTTLRVVIGKSTLRNNLYACSLVLYGFRTTTFVCLGTITSFAVDRALSLVFAMRYHSNITTNTSTMWCLTLWVISIVFTAISFRGEISVVASCVDGCFNNTNNTTLGSELMIGTALVCFSLITVSYVIIYRKVRQYINKISPTGHSVPGIVNNNYHYRASVKIFILILLFVMFFLPSAIYHTVLLTTDSKYQNELLRRIVGVFFLLNSCANPVMYALRFKECRLHCIALICFWNKDKVREIRFKQMFNPYSYYHSSEQLKQTDHDVTEITTK